MSAFDIAGRVISVGDAVSILGNIVSVGPGNDPGVIIQPPLSTAQFTALEQDIYTTEGTSCGGAQGNQVTSGNDCVTRGVVTAIAGSGNTATLSVQLSASGFTVSVPSGACYTNGA
jgi:hypothetical protein